MAPEVATNCAYDESVDVYSLSLVLWEIASLERPYKGYNKVGAPPPLPGLTRLTSLTRLAHLARVWPERAVAPGWYPWRF